MRHVNRAAPIFLSVVILSIILLLLGIFLFAGGAYKGALSWSDRDFGDNVKPDFEKTDVLAASRGNWPSRHLRRRGSYPSDDVVGGLFSIFDFGRGRRGVRTGRGDGVFVSAQDPHNRNPTSSR